MEAPNQPPEVTDDSSAVEAFGSRVIDILANDSDYHGGLSWENNLPMTVYDFTQPTDGTVVLSADGRSLIYSTDRYGFTTSFQYRAADSMGAVSDWGSVTVEVAAYSVPGIGNWVLWGATEPAP